METRQMTPFFSSTFPALIGLQHSFLYLKIVKIHFYVVPAFIHSGL